MLKKNVVITATIRAAHAFKHNQYRHRLLKEDLIVVLRI